MNYDKETEKKRYNIRAERLIRSTNEFHKSKLLGVTSMKLYLRKPYEIYQNLINCYLNKDSKVLEIGSGIGTHSEILLKSGADVTFTDISAESLKILNTFFKSYTNLKTLEADMENLPLEDDTFNVVVSAGSISYGDKNLIQKEIYRILKPDGYFIMVDTLNNNPIYRLNRYFKYLKGKRSKSTLVNMLSFEDIMNYEKYFMIQDIFFFGSLIWLEPIFKLFFSDKYIDKIFKNFDDKVNVKKSAFKFVTVMKKC